MYLRHHWMETFHSATLKKHNRLHAIVNTPPAPLKIIFNIVLKLNYVRKCSKHKSERKRSYDLTKRLHEIWWTNLNFRIRNWNDPQSLVLVAYSANITPTNPALSIVLAKRFSMWILRAGFSTKRFALFSWLFRSVSAQVSNFLTIKCCSGSKIVWYFHLWC